MGSVLNRMVLVLMLGAFLAVGCGTDDNGNSGAKDSGAGEDTGTPAATLTESGVRKCFKDAGLRVEPAPPEGGGDFRVSFGGGQEADVFVEPTAAYAENAANYYAGADIENAEEYFPAVNNAWAAFDEDPTDDELATVEGCFGA
jgi:hypothetical protein